MVDTKSKWEDELGRWLGDKKTILFASHGLIATGETIEEAAYLAFFLERAAALQLAASAAGTVHPVNPGRDFLVQYCERLDLPFGTLRPLTPGLPAPS